MAKQRGPSAFSDSPEDLIGRAEEFAEREDVPRDVCQLLVDIGRALEKERGDRVTYTQLAREAMAAEAVMAAEVGRLRDAVARPYRLALGKARADLEARLPSSWGLFWKLVWDARRGR